MITGKEVNRVALCLLVNKRMINHAEIRMIDPQKPTTVYLASIMRKGENEVGLLRFREKLDSAF